MTDIAIRVDNLSKLYHLGALQQRHDTLRDALTGFLPRIARITRMQKENSLNSPNSRQASQENSLNSPNSRQASGSDDLWALKDVSFEVQRGEVVGIIGRNGAGKSTLLKILSRITEPTSGRAEIHGRVGSLLEVGTGFHPELTGRENIYLNGAILGMRRAEIARQFDEIVAFAEIERFLDTPVKRYSSGMYVRLAFAVAAHLEPEILLVDEVLAVGDAQFQEKCLGKMRDVATGGRTVLFVSHNMGSISQLCSRAAWITNGVITAIGLTDSVIAGYLVETMPPSQFKPEELIRTGTGKAHFIDVRLLDASGISTASVLMGTPLNIAMTVQSETMGDSLQFAIVINDRYGRTILHAIDQDDSFQARLVNGIVNVNVGFENVQLYPGQYSLGVWCGYESEDYDYIKECLTFHVVQASQSARVTEMRPGQAIFFAPTKWSGS
jgi:lipopolysaccharide transport system ATP-binding protein